MRSGHAGKNRKSTAARAEERASKLRAATSATVRRLTPTLPRVMHAQRRAADPGMKEIERRPVDALPIEARRQQQEQRHADDDLAIALSCAFRAASASPITTSSAVAGAQPVDRSNCGHTVRSSNTITRWLFANRPDCSFIGQNLVRELPSDAL